ncbi:MAG: hypothetical protein HKL99_15315 [Burkholderiales bacterium]|jgi:hypothetical protein|nr:hypothetical protein [Burkholderiales bacterium]
MPEVTIIPPNTQPPKAWADRPDSLSGSPFTGYRSHPEGQWAHAQSTAPLLQSGEFCGQLVRLPVDPVNGLGGQRSAAVHNPHELHGEGEGFEDAGGFPANALPWYQRLDWLLISTGATGGGFQRRCVVATGLYRHFSLEILT